MKNTTIFFMALAFFFILEVQSTQFQVGGDQGWIIPQTNDTEHFNEWASHNRFKINDTLRFVYKKDSVLAVTKEEYEKCVSSRTPMFFSNDGDTTFQFDRSGYFYFFSGEVSHCQRGLKMIIKVLEPENGAQTANQTSTTSEATSVLKMDSDVLSQTLMIVGIIAMFTVFFM